MYQIKTEVKMKKLKFNYQVALVFLILFTAINCTKQEKKPSVEADISAINELYNQASLACRTGDIELYLSLFTEDAVMMAPEIPAIIGKEELRPIIKDVFGLFDLDLPYTVNEAEVTADWAFARSSFQYSMTLKDGGESSTRNGKELDIFKRQTDGSWKIYMLSYCYDAPPNVE